MVPTPLDEFDRMQRTLERCQEAVDLLGTVDGADQEIAQRHLKDAVVHQREVEVDDLLAVGLHPRAEVDDPFGSPMHAEEVAEAGGVEWDVIFSAELID